MQAFRFVFSFLWAPISWPRLRAFLAETVETGDKNRDDFHFIIYVLRFTH